MRNFVTRKGLEVASWIAAIIGAPLAIYQIYVAVLGGSTNQNDMVQATNSNSQKEKIAGVPPESKVALQKQDNGTQIGFANEVIINNEIAGKLDTLSPNQATATGVKLAAFNINSNEGYWEGTPEDKDSLEPHIQYTYRGTKYWTELAHCMGLSNSLREKKTCGHARDLLPSFDVTLVATGKGQAVLNEIRTHIISMSEYQGSAGELPSAAIPISAEYKVRLPKTDSKKRIVSTGTIPPLMLERNRPARFNLLFFPNCQVECYYDLRVNFVLSSGENIATGVFRLIFMQDFLPEDNDSRIPAIAKHYWKNKQ